MSSKSTASSDSDEEHHALAGNDFQTRAWLHRIQEAEHAKPKPTADLIERTDRWFEAVEAGNIDLIAQLMKDDKTCLRLKTLDEGNTAVHVAAEENNVELLKILMDNGAFLEEKNSFGITAIGLCEKDSEVFGILNKALGSPDLRRRGALQRNSQ